VPPDRFRIATALPPDGGWRAELALDRQATPPRPVALVRVPPAVSGDATALASLARGVDLAARLDHPSLLPVQGLVEVGGGLAVVGAFREGETLRAVLDGGGPLTPALASRVVGDVARAVQAIHALAAAGARAFAHGAIRPESVLIAEDGAVLLTGLGRPTEPTAVPADDLEALPRLLAECLASGGAGGAVPPELAPFASEAGGAAGPRPAGAFADGLAAAAAPAAPGALVARVDSAIPKGAAARAQRRRALAQALLAEAGGEGERGAAATPPPGASPAVVPALTPPPFRGGTGRPLATPPPIPAVPASPTTPSPPRTAPVLVSASPRTGPPRVAPPAAVAAPAGPPASPGLLDDPRLSQYAAVVLGLIGFLAGFLLGRR
jgi:hypothetical protein